MNNPTKNSQEKVVLEWNGVVLKSMKDLREQATHDLLLTAHQSGELHRWLSQHYYEQEASQIETIRIEDRDCLAELCRILSVAYETGVSQSRRSGGTAGAAAPAVSWTSTERWQPIFPEKDPLILQRKMRFLYFT